MKNILKLTLNSVTICVNSACLRVYAQYERGVVSFDLDGEAEDIKCEQNAGDPGPLVSVVDLTDNGVEDVVLHTDRKILVFANPSQTREHNVVSATTNFTLY